MATVRLGAMTVGFDDVGSGDAVLLVHGHPFDRTMWRPQAEALAVAGWRVVVPDLRGYGETTAAGDRTTLDVFARDISALLDLLGIGEVSLAGLSMGGQIAMEFVRLYPRRVRALVLADTSPLAETSDGKRARHAVADRLVREGMWEYAQEILPLMIAPANIQAQPHVAEHVLSMMRRTDPQGAAAALRGRADRPDYSDTLRTLRIPTLVVVGGEDYFTSVADAEFMCELIPAAECAVIEGAGHMPNLERPAEFNERLISFLDAARTSHPNRPYWKVR